MNSADLFIFLDVHQPWQKVKVTGSRAAVDFAACMRELTDVYFPKAERIRVVLDNLSTHFPGSLYQAFPAAEARRVLRRLEFHYVPKHASWLNMVEIRSVCCADSAWTGASPPMRTSYPRSLLGNDNATRREPASIWMFTTAKARARMGHAYPSPFPPRASPDRKTHNHCAEVLVQCEVGLFMVFSSASFVNFH